MRSRSVPPCALARRPSPEAPPVRLAGLDYPATVFTPPVFRRQEPGSGSLAKAQESARFQCGEAVILMVVVGLMEWSEISFMARPKGPFLYRLVAVAESFAMDLHRRFFP